MTQGTNISLTIKNSLSYSIDAQLDKEFKEQYDVENVQLGFTEWQSVFDVIKEDNATGKKQYQGDDSDIRNGKHFQVDDKQQYQITESAWTKIVNIAKRKMGITEQSDNKAQVQTGTASSQNVEKDNNTGVAKFQETSDKIKGFLSKSDIDFDSLGELYKRDVVSKYNTMKDVKSNITDEELETRIVNYTKGWMYNNFEQKTLLGKNPAEFKSECKANTVDELKGKYTQFAKEYIEYYDKNSDGEIDVAELLYDAVNSHYFSTEKLNSTEAKQKAIQIVEDFTKNKLQPNENGNTDEKILASVISKLDFLNLEATNSDSDKTLNIDEIKAYLLATAQISDTNNDIRSDEVFTMATGIADKSPVIQKRLNDAYDFLK